MGTKRYTIVLSVMIWIQALPSSGFCMDRARKEAKVDDAVRQFGVSGKGVLIAILDRGIDWKHRDFRNADGTTRIEYIFDLSNDEGAQDSNNSYGHGTIFSKAQIDEALKSGVELNHRDAVGHGTTTAGIACGSGAGIADRRYRGVAPEASLIVVKIAGGAPAHGRQPEELEFFRGEFVPLAIDFARDKARELGMPCVICLNIGSQGGPTDGTSEVCRKIDATVGPEVPGLIFVNGPGDDGGRDNRAGGTIKQGKNTVLRFRKDSKTPIRLDLWYSEEDQLDFWIKTPRARYGPYRPPGENERKEERNAEFTYYHNSGFARLYGPTNAKNEIFVEIVGKPGEYAIALGGKRIQDGRFDATIGPNAPAANHPPFNCFLNHLAPGSIWDGATARHNICPGDYVVRNDWIDIDGQPRSQRGQGKVGELWTGSSTGPTFDGRLGVDFCVPCEGVFTSYSPTSYWATFRSNLINDGHGRYGRASAVSAANPFTAGVIALMLEMHPALDAVTAKTILQQASRRDSFTGPQPNADWGYGKLDVQRALELLSRL